MTDEVPERTQWQDRALERSLKDARHRAISRADRFIVAAAQLLNTPGRSDFTVQEVTDRSGMSLRSFYQHFATKDDLLLALFEESVLRYRAALSPRLQATEGAVAKLELLLMSSFEDRDSAAPASRGMVLFHWHLADRRRAEFVATLRPQVEMITGILEEGIAEGVFRTDVPVGVQASLVTQTVLSVLDLRALSIDLADEEIQARHLVAWCLSAVTA